MNEYGLGIAAGAGEPIERYLRVGKRERRMQPLEARAKKVLRRLDARVAANEQQAADERRQVQLVGEAPDFSRIGFRRENPSRLEAGAGGWCSHAVKLSAPPRGNKHHVAA